VPAGRGEERGSSIDFPREPQWWQIRFSGMMMCLSKRSHAWNAELAGGFSRDRCRARQAQKGRRRRPGPFPLRVRGGRQSQILFGTSIVRLLLTSVLPNVPFPLPPIPLGGGPRSLLASLWDFESKSQTQSGPFGFEETPRQPAIPSPCSGPGVSK